jgi:Tfp pilus assembly protein PilX
MINSIQKESGSALITSLIILTLLTIIGISATNTSMLETMIAATEKSHSEALYAAEAGVEHLRRNLKNIFIENNTDRLAAGDDPNWSFALRGSISGTTAATDISYEQGSIWITDGNLGKKYLYTVTIWDNQDGPYQHSDTTHPIMQCRAASMVCLTSSKPFEKEKACTDLALAEQQICLEAREYQAINDEDGIIYVRSEASGPSGGTSAVEITLAGGASAGEPLSGYNAQEGGGAGKNYNANDVNAIGNFTEQI